MLPNVVKVNVVFEVLVAPSTKYKVYAPARYNRHHLNVMWQVFEVLFNCC